MTPSDAVLKIELDTPGCIGCGACASLDSDTWEMVEIVGELKSKVKKQFVREDEVQLNREVADCCPVNVIHLIDVKTGKKLV